MPLTEVTAWELAVVAHVIGRFGIPLEISGLQVDGAQARGARLFVGAPVQHVGYPDVKPVAGSSHAEVHAALYAAAADTRLPDELAGIGIERVHETRLLAANDEFRAVAQAREHGGAAEVIIWAAFGWAAVRGVGVARRVPDVVGGGLPVSMSMAKIASLVRVAGDDMFSPVPIYSWLRLASMLGLFHTVAPDGPIMLVPTEF